MEISNLINLITENEEEELVGGACFNAEVAVDGETDGSVSLQMKEVKELNCKSDLKSVSDVKTITASSSCIDSSSQKNIGPETEKASSEKPLSQKENAKHDDRRPKTPERSKDEIESEDRLALRTFALKAEAEGCPDMSIVEMVMLVDDHVGDLMNIASNANNMKREERNELRCRALRIKATIREMGKRVEYKEKLRLQEKINNLQHELEEFKKNTELNSASGSENTKDVLPTDKEVFPVGPLTTTTACAEEPFLSKDIKATLTKAVREQREYTSACFAAIEHRLLPEIQDRQNVEGPKSSKSKKKKKKKKGLVPSKDVKFNFKSENNNVYDKEEEFVAGDIYAVVKGLEAVLDDEDVEVPICESDLHSGLKEIKSKCQSTNKETWLVEGGKSSTEASVLRSSKADSSHGGIDGHDDGSALKPIVIEPKKEGSQDLSFVDMLILAEDFVEDLMDIASNTNNMKREDRNELRSRAYCIKSFTRDMCKRLEYKEKARMQAIINNLQYELDVLKMKTDLKVILDNESKHGMSSPEADDGVSSAAVNGYRLRFLLKDIRNYIQRAHLELRTHTIECLAAIEHRLLPKENSNQTSVGKKVFRDPKKSKFPKPNKKKKKNKNTTNSESKKSGFSDALVSSTSSVQAIPAVSLKNDEIATATSPIKCETYNATTIHQQNYRPSEVWWSNELSDLRTVAVVARRVYQRSRRSKQRDFENEKRLSIASFEAKRVYKAALKAAKQKHEENLRLIPEDEKAAARNQLRPVAYLLKENLYPHVPCTYRNNFNRICWRGWFGVYTNKRQVRVTN